MFKIKLILLKIAIFFLRLIYWFIKLVPTKNKITMISRQSNSETIDFKLLKDELNKSLPDYKVVILCKKLEKGLPNKVRYIFHMFNQMYNIATSKVIILDSYCICASLLKHKKGLKIIQMWHAIGSMKKFGYAMLDKDEGTKSEIAKAMNMHKNYDYALISSFSFINDYIEGFNIERDKILEIPLPKVDLLIDEEYKKEKKNSLLKKYPDLKSKKNILYCPTFRKDDSDTVKYVTKLIECIDFDKYNLIYKPHPLSDIKEIDERVFTSHESTFDALFIADYVISDYSSVIYEAGLLRIPIYLYAYDWEDYSLKREINYNIKEDTPTLFTSNPKEIIKAIDNNNFDHKEFDKFIKENVSIPKNGCCNEIVTLIKKLLKDS